MNWLAHLLLSEPTTSFQVGNLLPDVLKAAELAAVPDEYRRGMACHRLIDSYTDTHPVVRRSVGRIGNGYRRFGGVLVDVFYDHFLANDWAKHSEVPLEKFIHGFYAAFRADPDRLPALAVVRLERLCTEDWLGSYSTIDGVRLTLRRISTRFRRPVALEDSVSELERHYEGLRADFDEFFPELRARVAGAGFNH